ncbi:hypothetical protein LXL04_014737 [Taraxacum kok-saghyz]
MDSFSLPSFYLSAPTSPGGFSPQNPQFYSTRSTPLHQETSDDEFNFGTTPALANGSWDQNELEYRLPARANSFSTMAFADELFCNGQVLPLKLPPRLQRSVPTSPRSLSSRIKNPFVQQCTWNDDFDPFMNALEKVSDETSGRVSVHRRSRSYSPFSSRTISRDVNWDQEQPQYTNSSKDLEPKGPIVTEMMERKGSMYSRWVRSQTMIKNQTPITAGTMIKRLSRRVRDVNFSNKETVKPTKKTSEETSMESKMQKVKSVLLRYVSLKKESQTQEPNQQREMVTVSKISYFKRLSLSFKTNLRKKELIESKMGVVKHETKPPRCFCYAPRIPMMKQALRISPNFYLKLVILDPEQTLSSTKPFRVLQKQGHFFLVKNSFFRPPLLPLTSPFAAKIFTAPQKNWTLSPFSPSTLAHPLLPAVSAPNLRFYSTISSPLHQVGDQKTIDEEFNFGSSRSLADRWPPSISNIAFANELFCDGHVLPLKLPPRLQSSVPTSPTALRSRTRKPFAYQCKWNDYFDPFMIALENVSEESGRRIGGHRRSRSYSPFRARNISDTIQSDQKEPTTPMIINNQSPINRTIEEHVKLLKNTSDYPACTESTMQKLKSVMLRYASRKKEINEKTEIRIWKVSYFKRLSLSLKTNRRTKESIESKPQSKIGFKDKLLQKINDGIGIGIRH